MSLPSHALEAQLFKLGLSSPDTVRMISPRTRDIEDVSVLRCERSGVIYLSRIDQGELSHYQAKEAYKSTSPDLNRRQTVIASREDVERRAQTLAPWVANKVWLDFGTGSGGVLERLKDLATEACGCEPQAKARDALASLGCRIYPDITDIPAGRFEVISLFHVLEHLVDPIGILSDLWERLIPGGRLVVEVPHARDFLLDYLELKAFKEFTLWSEHLMLHTRQSLELFLNEVGFRNISIQGVQRYPLANHLHWLSQNQAGGHVKWPEMRSPELDRAYASHLAGLDRTDTLVAFARKPLDAPA